MNVRITILCSVLMVLLAGCVSTTTGGSERKENPKDAAAYNVQLGIAYLKQGNVSAAREKIERALKQDPGSPDVQTAAALLYDRMGEPSRADGHYAAVVRLKPKDAEALNNYGVFLCRNKRTREGEERFLQAATSPLNRAPAVAYTNAGLCMRGAGKLDEAQRYFEKALTAQQPAHRDALYYLGELHLDRGRATDARLYLQRLMDGVPATAETLWLGVRVEKALGNLSAAEAYAKRLKSEYPSAEQTRALIASERKTG
jgi:type IV pilus assembly protein PilF